MKRIFVILLPLFFAACTLIDDDLSVCGEELVINYRLQLRTALSMQLQAELSAETDTILRDALEEWLSPIFTDHAKDIDLHFFSADEDIIRRRIQDIINANQASYTINLPKENYMHLALANMAENNQMLLQRKEHSQSMVLELPDRANLQSLNTGVFTARLPMEVNDQSSQFDVFLYMVNAAVALVVDTTGCDSLVAMSGAMHGGASGFMVRDSIYDFSRTCDFRFEEVPVVYPSGSPQANPNRLKAALPQPKEACLATVGMPTADDQPWTVSFVATLQGNRHATSTLTLNESLKAGSVRVIHMRMNKDGGLEEMENKNEVGITVTLDWKDGGDHHIEL